MHRKHMFVLDSFGGENIVEEKFLQSEINFGDSKILIFARQRFLDLLADTDNWLGDGTFKSAPPLFTQLFIIHAKWRNTHRVVPCIYTLLPNKLEATYAAMLREVVQLFTSNISRNRIRDGTTLVFLS
jgi:hypothetical protein